MTRSERSRREFDGLTANYDRLRSRRSQPDARRFVEWIRACSSDRAFDPSLDRSLDVACGPGTLTRAVARKSRSTVGFDISSAMLLAAGQHQATRRPVSFARGDACKLPFATGAFDLVTCAYSIANFAQLKPVLREFARVTRKRGRIALMDVVAPEDAAGRLELNRWEALRSEGYARIRSRRELEKSFGEARLKVGAVQFHYKFQPVSEWLSLTSAARRRRCSRALAASIRRGDAGACIRRRAGKDVFRYKVAWFLLHHAA